MISRQGMLAVVGISLTLMALMATFARASYEPSTRAPAPTPVVLIGAGDISVCGNSGANRTAELIERLVDRYPDAAVFTAGDNAQTMGTLDEYTQCFRPSWGRFQERIHPSPGNHDWFTDNGIPYFTYFGDQAGQPGLGYYSYDLGDWHIVSLNSNCDTVGCDAESGQAGWLRTDLQENGQRCTLLYWHHPLWSSGKVEISTAGSAFWRIASEFGVEMVVNGHDHHYERFAPLDREGQVDRNAGTRLFIVGTGGAWLFDVNQPSPATEALDNSTHGVILFLLYPGRYDWMFIPVDAGGFTDTGSGICH